MIPSPRRAGLLLLAVPVLALSACGGSSDSDKIKDIVKQVDKEGTALCDHATDKLLAQVGGSVEKCKATARGYQDQTDKSKVEGDIKVKVNGDSATADFETTKGHDSATFVKENGEWKIDSVAGP
jgi:hypothetical protein